MFTFNDIVDHVYFQYEAFYQFHKLLEKGTFLFFLEVHHVILILPEIRKRDITQNYL